ncbi:polyprenol reductase [Pseudophryne corroboree]|uniref:polyprenol reductase n=1 Tax=Pseudophryne corroboree TaxID=495146 RepID=UPI003081B5B7
MWPAAAAMFSLAMAGQLSAVAGVWLLLDVIFLLALFLHLLGGRSSLCCRVFQDLIRYGKTKLGGRPGWLRHCDLPKRWFSHFYYVSVFWNGALLGLLVWSLLLGGHMPAWIQSLINFFNKDPQHKVPGEEFSTLVALFLLWLHSLRRLVECLFVSVYSNGVIHICQYCLGIGYYFLMGITLLDHAQMENKVTATELVLQVRWYHLLGVLLYAWASLHQHRCSVILANLRKSKSGKVRTMNHSVPTGDWFESVSCPHYFAELLIYISIAILFGLAHITLWLVVLFVLFNQSLAAILCHEFYHEKFDSYPAHRKAFIPYVF